MMKNEEYRYNEDTSQGSSPQKDVESKTPKVDDKVP